MGAEVDQCTAPEETSEGVPTLFILERRKVLQLLRWMKKLLPSWASAGEESATTSGLNGNYRFHWDKVLRAEGRDQLSVYVDMLNEILKLKRARPDVFPLAHFLEADRTGGAPEEETFSPKVSTFKEQHVVKAEAQLVDAVVEAIESLDILRSRDQPQEFHPFLHNVEKDIRSLVSSRIQEILDSTPSPDEVSQVLSSVCKHYVSTLLQGTDMNLVGNENGTLMKRLAKDLEAVGAPLVNDEEEEAEGTQKEEKSRKRGPAIVGEESRRRKVRKTTTTTERRKGRPPRRSAPPPLGDMTEPSASPRDLSADAERPKSGVPGVHWATRPRGWVASWKEDGKRCVKYFPVSHFNLDPESARKEAVNFKMSKIQCHGLPPAEEEYPHGTGVDIDETREEKGEEEEKENDSMSIV